MLINLDPDLDLILTKKRRITRNKDLFNNNTSSTLTRIEELLSELNPIKSSYSLIEILDSLRFLQRFLLNPKLIWSIPLSMLVISLNQKLRLTLIKIKQN